MKTNKITCENCGRIMNIPLDRTVPVGAVEGFSNHCYSCAKTFEGSQYHERWVDEEGSEIKKI